VIVDGRREIHQSVCPCGHPVSGATPRAMDDAKTAHERYHVDQGRVDLSVLDDVRILSAPKSMR
jgi:hypothetical protein